jgi:biotin carboxyl carrier protein
MNEIKSPVTGIVVVVCKKRGDVCQPAECLLILESMKMEFNVDATTTVNVEQVLVEEGETVEQGQLLVRVRPQP